MPERITFGSLEEALSDRRPTEQSHVQRYLWAAEDAPRSPNILDAACGCGFGAALLAREIPHAQITGVDNNEEALRHAETYFSNAAIRYIHADLCHPDLPQTLGRPPFDYVISFETIEHLDDPNQFMLSLKSVSVPGCPMMISIPLNHSDTIWHRKRYAFEDAEQFFWHWLRIRQIQFQRDGVDEVLVITGTMKNLEGEASSTQR